MPEVPLSDVLHVFRRVYGVQADLVRVVGRELLFQPCYTSCI